MPQSVTHSADHNDPRALGRRVDLSMTTLCREIYRQSDSIHIKNEQLAVANLVRIVDATLTLANRKGFAAMSLRDLARQSGLSLGGLYAYINGKDDLVRMIQQQGQRQIDRVMTSQLDGIETPRKQLAVAIRTHLYLSEIIRPWFVFLYMEARHLATAQRRQALRMEQAMETRFANIIQAGIADGSFHAQDATVAAGMLKALLQDWYLKHGKHTKRGLRVSDYANAVQALMDKYLG